MKGGVRPSGSGGNRGFTILETMIVLAISMGLLLAAATLINGRQAHTEFSQGIQQLQSQLQQDINDVTNGYYPNDGAIKCVDGGGSGPVLQSTATDEGTNDGCVFLGKVLQFAVGGQDDTYNVYTAVGLRSGEQSLSAARPRLIAQTTSEAASGSSSVPDVFVGRTMPYGLSAVSMYYGPSATPTAIGAVGFLSRLGASASGKDVDIVAIPATALGMSKGDAVQAVNGVLGSLPAAAIDPPEGIHICLKSGGTNQSALMTLGGNSAQTAVSVAVKGDTTC